MAQVGEWAGSVVTAPLRVTARRLDAPLRGWQRLAGQTGMAAFFLLPNMSFSCCPT